jgi:hypothetical protein
MVWPLDFCKRQISRKKGITISGAIVTAVIGLALPALQGDMAHAEARFQVPAQARHGLLLAALA